jgi:guanine deaminase
LPEPDPEYMRSALAEARKNLKDRSGGPFGSCIVRNGKILAVERNTVLGCKDATCHAEINAIRKACAKLKDNSLSGCVIYSTTEPCPMCFGAIHWAKIDAVYFGTRIKDVKKLGFDELKISCRKMKRFGASKVKIVSGFLAEECFKLLEDWSELEGKQVY